MDGRSKRPLWVVLGVVVVAAVGGAALATRGGDEPDADALLERASALVEDVEGFRIDVTSEERSTTGDAGGAGSESTFRTVTTGVVSGEDWRMTTDASEWADESVAVDDVVYVRSARDVEGLATEPWVTYPEPPPLTTDDLVEMAGFVLAPPEVLGDDLAAAMPGGDFLLEDMLASERAMAGTSLAASVYLGGVGGGAGAPGMAFGGTAAPIAAAPGDMPAVVSDPRGYARAIAELEDAQVVSGTGPAGGPTIRATRTAPADLAEAADSAGIAVPDGLVEVDLDAGGRPATIRVTVEGEGAARRDEVRFADWGAVAPVGVPDGEVDATPWVDEEAVAAVRQDITPVWPTAVPEGMALTAIYAIGPDEAAEWGQPCGELDLLYGPPLDDPLDQPLDESLDAPPDPTAMGPVLVLALVPQACASAIDPTPFAPAGYGDVPVRTTGDGLQVLVGDTVVRLDVSPAEEELAALVPSFQPFDLDAELARLNAAAEAAWPAQPTD